MLNIKAWNNCYLALDYYLLSGEVEKVYLLIGPQGAGKTTWARQQQSEQPKSLFFDAILVKKSERKLILDRVKAFNIPCIAVYFNVSLEECLSRNQQRPSDEFVDEQALKNVYLACERPSLEEGFKEIIYL